MKKTALLLIIVSLLSLFLVSCGNNEKTTEEAQTNIEEKEVVENNLYDPDLIGTWILYDEEKPMQLALFFDNGKCFNYYFVAYDRKGCYKWGRGDFSVYDGSTYFSRSDSTEWYTNKEESIMVNNGHAIKYTINNDTLTILDQNENNVVFKKTNENYVDIIIEDQKLKGDTK